MDTGHEDQWLRGNSSMQRTFYSRLKVALKIYNYFSKRQTPMPLTPQQQKL